MNSARRWWWNGERGKEVRESEGVFFCHFLIYLLELVGGWEGDDGVTGVHSTVI